MGWDLGICQDGDANLEHLLSSLQTNGLDQGLDMRRATCLLHLQDGLASFCVEFSLFNPKAKGGKNVEITVAIVGNNEMNKHSFHSLIGSRPEKLGGYQGTSGMQVISPQKQRKEVWAYLIQHPGHDQVNNMLLLGEKNP